MKKYSPADLKLWAHFATNAPKIKLESYTPSETCDMPETCKSKNVKINTEVQVCLDTSYADAMMEQLELRRSCIACNDTGEVLCFSDGDHKVKCPCQNKEGDK